MKKKLYILLIIPISISVTYAQQGMGVGTNNPLEMLHVSGAIKVGTDFINSNASPVGGAGTIRFRSSLFEGWNGSAWVPFGSIGDSDWIISGNDQYSAVSGNVGIGTNSPGTKFHIFSTTNPLVTIESNAGATLLLDRGTTGNEAVTQYLTNGTTKWIAGMDNQPSVNANDFAIKTTNNASPEFLLTATGNVGIGTSTPGDELHVEGAIRMVDGHQLAGRILVSDANGTMRWTDPATITTNDDGDWTVNGNDIYNTNTGNLGVGTSSPSSGFHVAKTDGVQLNVAQGSGALGGLYFREGYTNANNRHFHLGIVTYDHSSGGSAFSDGLAISGYDGIAFTTNNLNTSAIANVRMFIAQAGNIGVGTTSPNEILHLSRTGGDAILKVETPGSSNEARLEVHKFGSFSAGVGYYPGNASLRLRTNTNDAIVFEPNATEVMRVKENGVGIMNGNPQDELHVANPSNSSTTVTIESGNQQFPRTIVVNPTTHTTSSRAALQLDEWILMQDRLGNGNKDFSIYQASGNNHRLTISSNGNVGIGDETPDTKLDVEGSIQMVDGNQLAGRIPVSDANGTMTWTDPVTITTAVDDDWVVSGSDQYSIVSGNVGIGTTTPANKLDVNGTGSFSSLTPYNTTTGTNIIQVTATTNIDKWIRFRTGGSAPQGRAGLLFSDTDNDHYFMGVGNDGDLIIRHSTENSTAPDFDNGSFGFFRIQESKLGLQVANPTTTLHVYGDKGFRYQDTHQADGYIAVSDQWGNMTWTDPSTISSWTISGNNQSSSVSGNVGIGTASPSGKLHVFSNTNPKVTIESNAGATLILDRGTANSEAVTQYLSDGIIKWLVGMDNLPSGNASDFAIKTTNNGSPEFLLTSAGNLGVGNDSPTSKLHVVDDFSNAGEFTATVENTGNGLYSNGLEIKAGQNTQSVNNRFISFVKPNGSEIGAVRQITSSSVDYNTTSDERLKTNIHPTTKGLNDLMAIEVKDYVYKQDIDRPQTGFIAQQVYDIYPNAVSVGGNDVKTDPWMMDYGKMTPLLVKAVQDLQKIVEDQQKQIDKLTDLVDQ